MNELKISYCIKCGASNAGYLTELGNGRYSCKYCGSAYKEDSAAKDIEHILASMGWTVEAAVQRGLYAAKEEKIANCRAQLYKVVHEEYLSDREILKWADAIKAENAGDFMAEFYSVAVSKNVREINDFLDGIDLADKQDYIEDVVEFMLKTADYGNILSVENLIDAGIRDERQTAYLDRVHELAENLKGGLYDTELPRDAFIAYSSKDFKEVNRIVTELEEQGLECFVAMRNLRHGKGARENYITELQKAMNCCKCFVFISSRNSRSPDCDAIKIELPYMRDVCKEKPRIEYVLDTVKTGNFAERKVKDFFDGLEYCRNVDDLASRIGRALEKVGVFEESKPSAPKKYCVFCLTENDLDVRFCKECGKNEFVDNLAKAKARYKEFTKEEALREVGASRRTEEVQDSTEESKMMQFFKFAQGFGIAAETHDSVVIRQSEEKKARRAEERRKAEETKKRKESADFFKKGVDYWRGQNGVTRDYEKAVEYYRKAADLGNADAQFALGNSYDYGYGVKQSYEKAVEWYQKAAKQGHAVAQSSLGQCYEYGLGVEQSNEQAAEWYQKAAKQGAHVGINCLVLLGDKYRDGRDVEQSYAKAIELYGKAAEQKDKHAQCALGRCYSQGQGVPQSDEKAVSWYRLAAEQGDAEGQYALGGYYAKGQVVDQSYEESFLWYKRSAEQGFAKAQCRLGECYAYGLGTEKSNAKAFEWYEKSAEGGDAEGQYRLGDCYESGIGIARSYEQAVKWYKKAAEQGYKDAQFHLGYCYEIGQGVTQSYERAAEWYQNAAKQGHMYAQRNLALCYEHGNGVPMDLKKAVECLRKSANQGCAAAQCSLGDLYDMGKGVPQSCEQAAKWYEKAAAQGEMRAQHNLGVYYKGGKGTPQSYEKAVELFRKSADQGYAAAQCDLGICYEYGYGVSVDFSEAEKWYKKAAGQGDETAVDLLTALEKHRKTEAEELYKKGKEFYDGTKDIKKDYEKAAEYFQKAADWGNIDAQCGLGIYYQYWKVNYKEAVGWYRKAADRGHADAQNRLGVCYMKGNGVTQFDEEAVEWFYKAANQGHMKAQYNLGLCYRDGHGVSQDYKQSAEWFRKAADQGCVDAQCSLGLCYEKGQGVSRSYEQAVEWYRKAAQQNHAEALYRLGKYYDYEKGDSREAWSWYLAAYRKGNLDAKKALKAWRFRKYR